MDELLCTCGHDESDHGAGEDMCNIYGCMCNEFELKEPDDFSDSGSELNK